MPAVLDLCEEEENQRQGGAEEENDYDFKPDPGEGCLRPLLYFEQDCLDQLFSDHGATSAASASSDLNGWDRTRRSKGLKMESSLVVFAEGLGIEELITRTLIRIRTTLINQGSEQIVAVLGPQRSESMDRSLFRAGLDPLIDLVNATPENRTAQYLCCKSGSAVLIKSQALSVDILQRHVSVSSLAAVIVINAHFLKVDGLEALVAAILHRHAQPEQRPAILAFSDCARRLTPKRRIKGLMRALCLNRLIIYPRYHVSVKLSLDDDSDEEEKEHISEQQKHVIVEVQLKLTDRMKELQNLIIDTLKSIVSELNRSTDYLKNMRFEEGLEQSLMDPKQFNRRIKSLLNPHWHGLSVRTRDLSRELTTLSDMMTNLIDYDCIHFYQHVCGQIRIKSANRKELSLWARTETGERIIPVAESRLFDILYTAEHGSMVPSSLASPSQKYTHGLLTLNLEWNPKWKALSKVMEEIREARKMNGDTTSNILIIVGTPSRVRMVRDICNGRLNQKLQREWMAHLENSVQNLIQRDNLNRRVNNNDESVKRRRLNNEDGSEVKLKTKREVREQCLKEAYYQSLSEGVTPYDFKQENEAHQAKGGLTALSHALLDKEWIDETQQWMDVDDNDDERSKKSLDNGKVIIVCVSDLKRDPELLPSLIEHNHSRFVVLYDQSLWVLRQLEVITKCIKGSLLRIYWMIYAHSFEEQRHLSLIKSEMQSFDSLMRFRGHGLATHFNSMTPIPRVFSSSINGTPNKHSSKNKVVKIQPRIIIDSREFRSSLPFALFKAGFRIEVNTFSVGDYILSPDMCVERKSINDLMSSLKHGRLFSQTTKMSRCYERYILLIEWVSSDSDDLNTLSIGNEKGGDSKQTPPHLRANSPQAKFAVLCIKFGKLGLIWSPSLQFTAKVFARLKSKRKQPSMEGVIEEADTEYSDKANDVLRRLPGIDQHNVHRVCKQVKNLRELFLCSEERLSTLLGSEIKGKMLFQFLNLRAKKE